MRGQNVTGIILNVLKKHIKSTYDHQIDTPEARKKSTFYAKWIDLGFLRRRWTNDGQIAPDVWRSNNPTAERLERYAERGITTIINLRHDINTSPVKFEQETCEKLGLTCINYPMGARRSPTREELEGLILLFNSIKKPVLIHCKSGADRTGLAGAIWLLTQENATIEQASHELSLRYLHRRNSETGILDAVLDLYTLTAQSQKFEDWVSRDYSVTSAIAHANEHKIPLSPFGQLRSLGSDLYKYLQFREAHWHKSFENLSASKADRKRAQFFINWVDHGILRRFWTNRTEISPGVFRSNHPTGRQIQKEALAGLKTIINLRGASQQPQYLLEVEICRNLGIKLVDLPMTAGRKPTRAEMEKLLLTFDTVERPVLIHCKSGADRTGLAAAAYLLDKNFSAKIARQQLAARFLHFGLGQKKHLRKFISDYESERARRAISFRDWIANLD